jgi:hypothetical protein
VTDDLAAVRRAFGRFFCSLCRLFCRCKKSEVRIVPHLRVRKKTREPGPARCQHPFLAGATIVSFQLSVDDELVIEPEFQDAYGNPSSKVENVEYLVDNTDLGEVVREGDVNGVLVPRGPLGTIKVTLRADADMGAGVTPVIGTLDVDLTGGAVKVVTLKPGQVRPKRAPTTTSAPTTTPEAPTTTPVP